MRDKLEFSTDWLVRELIKTDFREKETGEIEVVRIKKKDLFNLFIKFIKLIERGE